MLKYVETLRLHLRCCGVLLHAKLLQHNFCTRACEDGTDKMIERLEARR